MSAQPESLRLACEYADAVAVHRLESLYGTSKTYTLVKATERDKAYEALAAELHRLHSENVQSAVVFVEHQRELSKALDQRDDMQKQVAEIAQLGMVLREQRDELLAAAQLTLTTFNVLGRPMPEDVGDALAAAIAKVEGGAA